MVARLRRGDGNQNVAGLRQLALNLLPQANSLQFGVNGQRLNAGSDETCLLHLLASPV
ncbi:MAG: hypothetical protein HZC41_02850 [Chloroflexi bacterium]|nr:hypothetical protein [Chloroflexota bacterium]